MKKEKVKKTAKQRGKAFLKVLLGIVISLGVIAIIFAVINTAVCNSHMKFIGSIRPMDQLDILEPTYDDDGSRVFTTDNDLKVMQLTDVHIGGGFMSKANDDMAINAVSAMIVAEKPDLVIVTGDIGYPVPFQAGTFNNKSSAKLFANLMEHLGVYWAPVYGNHDTEAYSYYSRADISKLYGDTSKYPHCLFTSGPEEVDGYGNYMIKVKNTKGDVTQCFVLLDSHSYVDKDYFGIKWKYDTIHQNQVQWYESELNRIKNENNGVMPESLVFFHIPIPEYKLAWDEYIDNRSEDTDNVKYLYGKVGESGKGIYTSDYNYGFFDKVKELGSTKGIFCGHDHLNNFSIDYQGVRLTYGYSIDYLAYAGIKDFGIQRGCTLITVKPDGTFELSPENYYQDKYEPTNPKEPVRMDDYNQ